jgi:hypothetical protein
VLEERVSEREVFGHCACGAVRFALELPTRFVAHCWCENCRRAHGAACVTWAGVLRAQLRIEAGADELRTWRTPTEATRSFCATCGATLFFESPRWEGEVHVAVAHFEGELDRAPKAHVYADRAPAWCPIHDELPRLGGESGTEPLA